MERSQEQRDAAAAALREVIAGHFVPVSLFYTLAEVFADVEQQRLFDESEPDAGALVSRALSQLWTETRTAPMEALGSSGFVALAARLFRLACLDRRRCRLASPLRETALRLLTSINELEIVEPYLRYDVYQLVGIGPSDELDVIGVQPCDLAPLARRLKVLSSATNRQEAGRAFQRLFMHLVDLYDLEAEPAYRVPGEEIDGAFEFDGATYLVEVKNTAERIGLAELRSFCGKVASKSARTRGLFVSLAGFADAVTQPRALDGSVLLMDRRHVTALVQQREMLPTMLKRLERQLATRGEALGSALWTGEE